MSNESEMLRARRARRMLLAMKEREMSPVAGAEFSQLEDCAPRDEAGEEAGVRLSAGGGLTGGSGRRAELRLGAAESRPGISRRAAAALVDRLAPLPFIAYLFPPWLAVVFAYHLLCDGTPTGRSLGKRLGRLRVVSTASQEPCGVARSILRRLIPALCQTAYCSWEFVWLALLYDLASFAFVLLDPAGRRAEDHLAGTQVITERAYKSARRAAANAMTGGDLSIRIYPRVSAADRTAGVDVDTRHD